ncbi:PilZ domain-containing protein [Legionella lytica]|uniref:PilZ domain-containing protein n=1 Tax=Legionella lytica TaxID=96232 RepID=A0ABY4Y5K2_9GAMM|nr:PilZ domain-containing protein [Legionella lytica]USQ12900.1 PilZ domain-containing protein [Legionella lytica]
MQQINCVFDNLSSLYAAYMPFVKGGGLFIRTQHLYELGSGLSLVVNLMNEDEFYYIDAKVVWITPVEAQASRFPGVGVQFINDHGCDLRSKIEIYLAEMLKSQQVTDTV